MALRLGLIFSRKFIQQRRKHVIRDVGLELQPVSLGGIRELISLVAIGCLAMRTTQRLSAFGKLWPVRPERVVRHRRNAFNRAMTECFVAVPTIKSPLGHRSTSLISVS